YQFLPASFLLNDLFPARSAAYQQAVAKRIFLSPAVAMVRVVGCLGALSVVVDVCTLIRKTIGAHSSANESRLDRLRSLLPRYGARAHHSGPIAGAGSIPTDA